MIRRLLGAAPALARQADVRFAAVALALSVLALLFSGWLIVDAPIPLDRDLLAMSPRVFPYLILLSTVAVAALFLAFRAREGGADAARTIHTGGTAHAAGAGNGDSAGGIHAAGNADPTGSAHAIGSGHATGSGDAAGGADNGSVATAAPDPASAADTPAGARASRRRQAAFLAIAVACALLLDTLGFIITMFILMASTSILVGNRNPLQILGISIVIPLGFYIAVTHVMRTALPEIDLVQRALAPLLRLLPAF